MSKKESGFHVVVDAGKRRFLRGSAAAASGVAALSMFPPSIRRALAIPAHNRKGTIEDVEHIVILMQENRSFDHYFGTLKGVRGFGDRITIPLPEGRSVWEQWNGARVVMPYHLDSRAGNAQRVDGTPHDYPDAHFAWDGGRMDKWPLYKQDHSMGYYRQAELEFQFALADAFTLCDAYHCSTHGGTNTNRLFLWTGTNDPSGAGNGPSTRNAGHDGFGPSSEGWTWKTYPERLQEAGVGWKVYQNLPDNYGDNPLVGFRQYRAAHEAEGNGPDGAPYLPWTQEIEARNPLYKGVGNTMPNAGDVNATEQMLADFEADVANGRLPQVSWIVATDTYSEHPGPSSPIQGAWYTQKVLDALTAHPEVWSKTVLFVTFDENDGFFDHLPPPAAPSLDAEGRELGASTVDTLAERHTVASTTDPADNEVYGPGPRVPMYVISPWSRGGWVNSQAFDHTSVLRFVEARFGVIEENISPWRRAVLGDLTSAFNFATPNHDTLPDLDLLSKVEADLERAAQEQLPQVPPPDESMQQLPVQEPGVRPSRPLPYVLHVHGQADVKYQGRHDRQDMTLVFSNTGGQGAVFHVYDRLHLERRPRRYTVEAGMRLEGRWSTADDRGRYDLWVLGPNGFHRHFQGDLGVLDAHRVARPEIRVDYDSDNGDVQLILSNTGNVPCTFVVTPNAYFGADQARTVTVGVHRREALSWSLRDSGCWYDFTVRVEGDESYVRRFCGRVETGRPSVSDPALGMR
ncbi:phosphocholine-specific phospholipase C [Bordetella sp. 2513F-2]